MSFARNAALVATLVMVGAIGSSVSAAPSCDVTQAAKFRAAGDGYRAHQQYAQAARWFLAAERSTRDCATVSGATLRGQSLVEAGMLFAKNGDYADALSALHAAQSQLNALGARDRQTATAVAPSLELVASVIAAINAIAQASM